MHISVEQVVLVPCERRPFTKEASFGLSVDFSLSGEERSVGLGVSRSTVGARYVRSCERLSGTDSSSAFIFPMKLKPCTKTGICTVGDAARVSRDRRSFGKAEVASLLPLIEKDAPT